MYYTLVCVLFIPLLYGKSVSTKPSAINLQSPVNVTESLPKDIKLTNVTIITEGGSVNSEIPITLPKENHTNLINLDKELGKTKVKSIVPRKGVDYNPKEDDTNSTKERLDTTILAIKPLDIKVPLVEPVQTKPSTKANLSSSSSTSVAKEISNTTSVKAETEKKKKPLTLSAEALNETDRRIAMANAKAGTSIKPEIHDQLPLPKVKYEQMASAAHPGMVMPVVITMLVVPMFAVLGYMALRRGQEAWKNRHYKRMDFLLDGMYND